MAVQSLQPKFRFLLRVTFVFTCYHRHSDIVLFEYYPAISQDDRQRNLCLLPPPLHCPPQRPQPVDVADDDSDNAEALKPVKSQPDNTHPHLCHRKLHFFYPIMRVILIDGQGVSATPSSALPRQTGQVSSSSLAKLFLAECNAVCARRIAQLSAYDVKRLGLSITTLDRLAFPVQTGEWLMEPLASIPNLFVEQVLQIFHILESHPAIFASSANDVTHVLGYSSGLLSGLCLATNSSADTPLSFLKRATFLFRLTLSLGLHCQISRIDMLSAAGTRLEEQSGGWSAAVLGPTLSELEASLNAFNAQFEVSSFYSTQNKC